MQNLKLFNECVGLIFSHLIDSFPKKIVFKCSDITLINESLDSNFVAECMEFLKDEGFIIYHQKAPSGDIFSYVRLSLKALVVLNSEPKSIKKSSTAQMIKSSATSKSFDVLGEVIIGLFDNFIKA